MKDMDNEKQQNFKKKVKANITKVCIIYLHTLLLFLWKLIKAMH